MKQITHNQLVAILRYELEYADIDPRKCLEFTIEDKNNLFTVTFKWYDGIITDSELDPTLQRDDRYIECDYYFRILKTESLNSLRSYIEDMVQEVELNEFKEERF